MGLRINVGLPGPFSVSAPLVPSTKPLRRAVKQAVRSSGSRSACARPCCTRPVERSYAPAPYSGALTARQAARLRARGNPAQESAMGAWVGVVLAGLALLVLFGYILFG